MVSRSALTFLLVLALCGAVSAQTANTIVAPAEGSEPKATLADARWLVGAWSGAGLGGVSEETWAEPQGGQMMGMYRLVTKGTVTFYEFMNLREEHGTLVLKLKHFNGDLTAWEDKERWVTFRLAKVAPNELAFGGLTFRKVDDTNLRIYLALRANGVVREEEFALTKR